MLEATLLPTIADLREQVNVELTEALLDGSKVGAKKGSCCRSYESGFTTKILAIIDAWGLSVSTGIASGEECEALLATKAVVACFNPTALVKPVGDKAYDSDPIDAKLAERDVEMIASNRRSRVRRTQDGRPLRRYRRR